MVELTIKDRGKNKNKLVINKSTLPKKESGKLIKSLKYVRDLPVKCADCRFRPVEEGGNGICTVFEKDSVCVIRKDIKKLVEQFDDERNSVKISTYMQDVFESNYEILKFNEILEQQSGIINPDRIKLINSLTNLGKVINEMNTKTNKIEIEERRTLTDDKKQEIARIISISKEENED